MSVNDPVRGNTIDTWRHRTWYGIPQAPVGDADWQDPTRRRTGYIGGSWMQDSGRVQYRGSS